MILVGGYNVYPREIDQVLFSHPDIQDAIAVGVPEEFRGEVVKVFIVKKPGCTLSQEQVIEFCEQHLVKYKVPKMVQFMDALPKTEANKVSRALLRKLHDEQQKEGTA
jgi:long-chain acyl-CoA synthetase